LTNSYFQVPPDSTGKKIATDQQIIGANTVELQYIKQYEPPTFLAIADRIVPAVNKYILTIFNTTSTRKVVIQRAYVYNWQTAAVTSGTLLEYEFRKITARTTGASITPIAYDSTDTLTAGITADSTTTAVTEVAGAAGLLRRGYGAGEETKVGPLTLENSMSVDDEFAKVYDKALGCKGITLRQTQGVTIKNISGTLGTISAVILFTDEPV
jgi:hypothetical protein